MFNLSSQFYYEARSDVEAFALDKQHLLSTLAKYPIVVLAEFQDRSTTRNDRLSHAIQFHKERHMIQMNKTHEYY